MKILSAFVLLIVALLALARSSFGTASAATEPAAPVFAGTLVVKTVNSVGGTVAGALVNVFPAGSSTPAASGTTNNDGKIAFNGLTAGNYTVFASKVGLVNGMPTAIFGSANVTVGDLPTFVTVKLVKNAP
ncbi:MAG: hypothetical protein ACKVWV_19720 [Planctomycetota bacterium]